MSLKVDKFLALPYWDTALDARLPDPRDSVLWTDELLGSSDQDGYVTDGPFAAFNAINWTLLSESVDVEYKYLMHYERYVTKQNLTNNKRYVSFLYPPLDLISRDIFP